MPPSRRNEEKEAKRVAVNEWIRNSGAFDGVVDFDALVRDAAARGAQIILLQELFETPYFCKDQLAGHFELATTPDENPALGRFASVAAELGVVPDGLDPGQGPPLHQGCPGRRGVAHPRPPQLAGHPGPGPAAAFRP